MASVGHQIFSLPNGSEFELFIDNDRGERQEIPIDQWPMEEFGDDQSPTDHDESEGESNNGQESELADKELSQGEEDLNPVQSMREALRSDHAAYNLTACEGGEWTSLQADAQQAQNALHEMSDEQRAIIRVLAHRQTHVALRMMGVSNIDPDSEAYQQQYNITVVSIVGGSIIRSQEEERAAEQAKERTSLSDLFNEQLRNMAAQFGQPQTAPCPRLFDFSGNSRNTSQAPTLVIASILTDRGETTLVEQPTRRTKIVATLDGIGRTLKDRAILQKWRERDIAESGQTHIPDQGIRWDNQGQPYDVDSQLQQGHTVFYRPVRCRN